MNLENLDTPNVVINEAIVEQNIQRVQSFFDGLGIAFRPHIKTHKSIEIAKLSFGYSLKNCALSVLTTVVSTPSSERCILDAGSKSLSSDLLNQKDYGFILEYPKASIGLLSEEHATIDLSKSAKKPVLKERVHIIPNHCCVVSNLFDEVYFYSSALPSFKKIKIDARGKVW